MIDLALQVFNLRRVQLFILGVEIIAPDFVLALGTVGLAGGFLTRVILFEAGADMTEGQLRQMICPDNFLRDLLIGQCLDLVWWE